jgi:hypothetical protein
MKVFDVPHLLGAETNRIVHGLQIPLRRVAVFSQEVAHPPARGIELQIIVFMWCVEQPLFYGSTSTSGAMKNHQLVNVVEGSC